MPNLATIIKNKKQLNNNYCLISYVDYDLNNLENKPIVKLKCGHCFYLQNILHSYKITNNTKSTTYMGKRKCPYCRQTGGYLPDIYGDKIKGIHKTKIKTKTKGKKTLRKTPRKKRHRCYAKNKTGLRKNKRCCNSAKLCYFKFVPIKYKSKLNIIDIDENVLEVTTTILKKRYFCGIHKNHTDT